ncbi:MAG TPA: DUF4931 domain-containing protein, partial [Thermoanaerobaculia bacterium]|nr:DUF4931 domain-containing protein [Thermoanaerobaculia bacterium]
PPEVLCVADGTGWRVRVFPNKYPATDDHEVIVETADHDVTFDRIAHAPAVVRVFVDRYRALSRREGVASVVLFRNCGPAGGASLAHPHSQVTALPFVPPRVARESAAFTSAAECPLCPLREHLIAETPHFLRIAPAGSQMPYEQWVIPRRHRNEIASLSDEEITDLAAVLQSATAAMQKRWASYNWIFMNFPRNPAAHFYLSLFPRVAGIAGFELESGSFIQVVDPEQTARMLRGS